MIRLHLLGSLDLRGPDGHELRSVLAQPKRLALLAYLAVAQPRGFHRRDTLVALFWPELDHEHARSALRKAVFVLREALGDRVIVNRGDEELGIAGDGFWCDAVAFEQALAAGRRVEALGFYEGDLLRGYFIAGAPEFERWLERERQRLRERAAAAAWSLADEEEARCDAVLALQWSRRAVELSPDDETAVRRLIAVLDGIGDRAGALHVYEEFARQLASDYEAEPTPETQTLIEAVRVHVDRISGGVGRQLGPSGKRAPGPPPGSERPPEAPKAEESAPAPRLPRRAWLLGALAGFLMVFGLFAAQAMGWLWPPNEPAQSSVAVLYFENLSRDTADAYVADGLTEELVGRLGAIGHLRVKGRAALHAFRSIAPDDVAGLGRALGVRYVVEGSVLRSDKRVRVSVRLVRVRDGSRVWGDQYDRPVGDLLMIQEDVATKVAENVTGGLLPPEQASLRAWPTQIPEAYDRFLRGNYYFAKRTPQGVARAIKEYQLAARLDPGFVRALARIGYGYAELLASGWDYGRLPRDSLLARGFAAADSARRIDSTVSDAWMARGWLLEQQYPADLASARRAFERAILLDPKNAEAHHALGIILWSFEEDSGAAAAYQRALTLQPDRMITLFELGALRVLQRRYDEGVALIDSALRVDPGYGWGYAARGFVHLLMHQPQEARRDGETAVRLGRRYQGAAVLAALAAHEGDTLAGRARVDSLLRSAVDSTRPTAHQAFFLSSALVSLGETERAVALLERVHPRDWMLWHYLRLPFFDPLRAYLRFQRIAEDARPGRVLREDLITAP